MVDFFVGSSASGLLVTRWCKAGADCEMSVADWLWYVAEQAESLGRAWRRVTWTMSAMDTSASDLSIGTTTKVIGRLWRGGVSKAETLDGAWKRDWIV
jgi:hypothetical protein